MAAGSRTVGVSLSEVSVRPVAGGAERAEWGRLMDAHHYLGFRCLFGGGVRHVAQTADGRWLALVGWQCGAFKVKARDAWIGWAPEQQFRRLRLVANNTRFLILPDARVRNLASRALSLSLRRLSSDMEAALRKHDGNDEARRCAGYVEANRARMRYPAFRAAGLPVGSGEVESSCGTVTGRLGRGGMRWSVDGGANPILTLRCWWLDGRHDDFFKARARPPPMALAA